MFSRTARRTAGGPASVDICFAALLAALLTSAPASAQQQPFITHDTKPGELGNDYHVHALGQDAVARVTATATELTLTIVDKAGAVIQRLVIPARRATRP